MPSLVIILVIVSLALALFEEVRKDGKSLLGWSVVFLALASLAAQGVIDL